MFMVGITVVFAGLVLYLTLKIRERDRILRSLQEEYTCLLTNGGGSGIRDISSDTMDYDEYVASSTLPQQKTARPSAPSPNIDPIVDDLFQPPTPDGTATITPLDEATESDGNQRYTEQNEPAELPTPPSS